MELTILNRKVIIHNPVSGETTYIDHVDWFDAEPVTGLFILYRGRSWKIDIAKLTKYNGSTTIPDFATIESALGFATGEESANASVSTALAASIVAKTSAGSLVSLQVYNDKSSAQYIQVFDAAALPANGAVPVYTFTLASKGTQTIDFGDYPVNCVNGIVIANSSTGSTLTVGSADCWFRVASY